MTIFFIVSGFPNNFKAIWRKTMVAHWKYSTKSTSFYCFRYRLCEKLLSQEVPHLARPSNPCPLPWPQVRQIRGTSGWRRACSWSSCRSTRRRKRWRRGFCTRSTAERTRSAAELLDSQGGFKSTCLCGVSLHGVIRTAVHERTQRIVNIITTVQNVYVSTVCLLESYWTVSLQMLWTKDCWAAAVWLWTARGRWCL